MTRTLTWWTLIALAALVAACGAAAEAPAPPATAARNDAMPAPAGMGPNTGMGGDMAGMDASTMDANAMPADPNAMPMLGRPVPVPGGAYRDLTVDEFQALQEQADFLLVNVHIPFAGNIPGTDLSIPYHQIEAYADQLPADKDAAIVVYCRSGSMSAAAARTLVQMGYTNVWNLAGGMNAWTRAGLPLDANP